MILWNNEISVEPIDQSVVNVRSKIDPDSSALHYY